jgi:ketosteroid isomerase-like protein
MSQENVEAFKRFIDGFNRRDTEAMLEAVDAEVEWRPASSVALGGDAAVYRGHPDIAAGNRDFHDSFAELQIDIPVFREIGDRVVGTGRIRTVGEESGVESWSPFGAVMRFNDGKVTQVRSYTDPREALIAAGCRSRRGRRQRRGRGFDLACVALLASPHVGSPP